MDTWEPIMIGPSPIGPKLPTKCSSGWEYTDVMPVGAVHSWWVLWMYLYSQGWWKSLCAWCVWENGNVGFKFLIFLAEKEGQATSISTCVCNRIQFPQSPYSQWNAARWLQMLVVRSQHAFSPIQQGGTWPTERGAQLQQCWTHIAREPSCISSKTPALSIITRCNTLLAIFQCTRKQSSTVC